MANLQNEKLQIKVSHCIDHQQPLSVTLLDGLIVFNQKQHSSNAKNISNSEMIGEKQSPVSTTFALILLSYGPEVKMSGDPSAVSGESISDNVFSINWNTYTIHIQYQVY